MHQAEQPDPAFARRFLAALPPDLAASFTPRQLMGVQRCFGLRHGGRHALDLRRSFWTPWGRFYVVMLAGPERRGPDRLSFERLLRAGGHAGGALVAAAVVLVLLLVAMSVLHALKLVAGIDLFPGIDVLPDAWLIRELRG